MEYILNEHEREHTNNHHNLHCCIEQLLECTVMVKEYVASVDQPLLLVVASCIRQILMNLNEDVNMRLHQAGIGRPALVVDEERL